MNYYYAIDILKNAFSANGFNTITHGDLSEVDLNRQTVFPLAHIVPQPSPLGERTSTFIFAVQVMDIVDWNKDDPRDLTEPVFGTDNTADVLSDLHTRAAVAIAALRSRKIEPSVGDKHPYEFSDIITLTPFANRHENQLTGWEFEVGVSLKSPAVTQGTCI